MRLFFGLKLPDSLGYTLCDLSEGMPGARWIDHENLHITVQFIGNVNGGQFREIRECVENVRLPKFHLTLATTGIFGGKKPHTLWVGVKAEPGLHKLRHHLEKELLELDVAHNSGKYFPHVTLARLSKEVRMERLNQFLAKTHAYKSEPFEVDAFYLFSSVTTHSGAAYTEEAGYPLASTERERLKWFERNGYNN